jgi:hypothetical protein
MKIVLFQGRGITMSKTALMFLPLLLVGLFMSGSVAADYESILTVAPKHPNPGEQIVAHLSFPLGGCTSQGTFSLSQSGRHLEITHTVVLPFVTLTGPCGEELAIGQLPIGRYILEWSGVYLTSGGLLDFSSRFSLSFVVGDGGPPDAIPTLDTYALMTLSSALMGLGLVWIRRSQRKSESKESNGIDPTAAQPVVEADPHRRGIPIGSPSSQCAGAGRLTCALGPTNTKL